MENNKKEAARKKSLGELGELFAIKALVDQEFNKVRNLNDQTYNEAFADLFCEKDDKKYIISVKARNKYQKNGTLNSRYKLGNKVYEMAETSKIKYDNAEPCWLAVQFDSTTFSVYFGKLSELNGKKAIPVDKCERNEIGEVWVKNKRHYFDFDFYTNK